jgi:hypothetical protein
MMKRNCSDFQHVLREGTRELPDTIAEHVLECPDCHEEWSLWQDICAAAPGLHKSWDSSELWPRIERSLIAEIRQAHGKGRAQRQPRSIWRQWQAVAAGLALLLISAFGGWMALRRSGPAVDNEPRLWDERRLLTERALNEIEKTEVVYLRSIEKLSALAAPRIEQPQSALLSNYREKLLLIESAIQELRANIERNRFNAHLRKELLSIYREKQHTLEELVEDETHEN